MQQKNIFIITRRDFSDKSEDNKPGIGLMPDLSIDQKKVISIIGTKLFEFWIDTLVSESVIKDIIKEIIKDSTSNFEEKSLKELIQNDDFKIKFDSLFSYENDNIDYIDDIFSPGYYKGKGSTAQIVINKNSFNKIIDYYHKIHLFEKDYLINIINPKDGIYVYHHWLDKQGVDHDHRHKFLPALRETIINLLPVEVDKNEVKVNWIIHDTDLGISGGDGLIKFDNDIKNENNPYFYENCDAGVHADLSDALAKDNIWIFNHTKGVNGIYDKFILNQDYDNAEELYKKLVYDEEKLIQLAKIFQALGVSEIAIMKDELFKVFMDFYNRGFKAKVIPITYQLSMGKSIENVVELKEIIKLYANG